MGMYIYTINLLIIIMHNLKEAFLWKILKSRKKHPIQSRSKKGKPTIGVPVDAVPSNPFVMGHTKELRLPLSRIKLKRVGLHISVDVNIQKILLFVMDLIIIYKGKNLKTEGQVPCSGSE